MKKLLSGKTTIKNSFLKTNSEMNFIDITLSSVLSHSRLTRLLVDEHIFIAKIFDND